MSRHTIETDRYAEVSVGWDRPMGTFFLQVHGEPDEYGSGPLQHWLGRKSGEIPCARILCERAQGELGIDIPVNTLRELIEDQDKGR